MKTIKHIDKLFLAQVILLFASCALVNGKVWKSDKYFIEIQETLTQPNNGQTPFSPTNAMRISLGPNNGKPCKLNFLIKYSKHFTTL